MGEKGPPSSCPDWKPASAENVESTAGSSKGGKWRVRAPSCGTAEKKKA